MKYLKIFNNHTEYLKHFEKNDSVIPLVAICEDEEHVHYMDDQNYEFYKRKYLTFTALQDGTFKFRDTTSTNTLSYSLDNGSTWESLANNTDTPTVARGKKILWKGTCTPQMAKGIGTFISTAQFDVEGNAMSLLFGDDFIGQTSLANNDFALYYLFNGNTNISDAKNLSLPAETLVRSCYDGMFRNCTSLTTAPQLPATTLATNCYQEMFEDCTSLTTAPELPATALANGCYRLMFYSCTSLTTAPQLPATTLASNCYQAMFNSCTHLITAPELPATTLAESCYNGMFWGCTSLTTAQELPATTLASSCYQIMFYGCTSLTTAPSVLPATTLVSECYKEMFASCTSLTTAPELPATTLVRYCYQGMFSGCTNLQYIKALFTTTPSIQTTADWVSGVASTGTFVKNSAATWTTTGVNAVPAGWTIQTASA